MEKWLSYRVPSWEQLGNIIDHRVWNVAFLFFVLMPVIAFFFQHLPKEIDVKIGNNEYTLSLGFPFPWWLLYFSALFISLAKALYFVFSPPFIKKFPDYEYFSCSGRGGGYLQKILHELIPFWERSNKDSLNKYIQGFDEKIHLLNSSGIKHIIQNEIWSAGDSSFWLVHDLANFCKTYLRLFCTISIILAGVCFGAVVAIKISTVINLLV